MERRLPVYLLIDTSESMAGPAIESVTRGVDTLVKHLRGIPQALESVYLSVITFDRTARQITPLTELLAFQPPKLSVRSGTALGAALRVLADAIRSELVRSTPTQRGDYRPLAFLMTDGQPTDSWEAAAAELKNTKPRPANIYAIALGDDVDLGVLKRITDIVLHLPELTPEKIGKFFVWLSSSVQTASTRVASAGDDDAVEVICALPDVLERVGEHVPASRPARQVFLHARCSRTRKPYLMRFSRQAYGDGYDAIASHALEFDEPGEAGGGGSINTSRLNGCPPCPHCGNSSAASCPCGGLFCLKPGHTGAVICPKCEASLSQGTGGSFDVGQSHG